MHGQHQLIPQRVIVVGGDIVYNLSAAFRLKAGSAVLPAGHRMEDHRFQPRPSVDKAWFLGVEYASLDYIPGIITENPDAVVQVSRILFVSRPGALFHRRIVGTPGFPIEQLLTRAECLVQLRPNPVHQLHRKQPHQVKPESVHVIFPGPVHDGVRYIIIHHGTPCGNVISAGRTVGKAPVLLVAVIIPRHHPLQPGILVMGMIVNHIHNNPDAAFMQGLNHLLALPDSDRAVIWVRSVRAFRYIVVHRVIAPVKLLFVPRLVYGTVVKKGQQMHMGNTQFFQIIHTGGIVASRPCHGKSLILPPVFPGNAAVRVMGKVLDMQFINNLFTASLRRPVRLKSRRIRPGQVHRHASAAIAAAACRIWVRGTGVPAVYPHQIIIIHAMEIFRKLGFPCPLFTRLHLSSAIYLFRNTVLV